ncbi:ATP-binding protein [Nonomuraea spiralis]|uniref:ATP-binding protein n=1 Tax=Nonomuraea spiralis TaxID=46182 RepID=UPI00227D94C8|nr:ATP-binding protein [Nonomuraea spiralis]
MVWNAQLHGMYGMAPDEPPIPLEQLAGHAHPDDAVAIGRFVRAVLHHRRPASTAYRLRRSDGTVRHIRVVAEPVFDDSGLLLSIRGAYQDIARQPAATLEQRLEPTATPTPTTTRASSAPASSSAARRGHTTGRRSRKGRRWFAGPSSGKHPEPGPPPRHIQAGLIKTMGMEPELRCPISTDLDAIRGLVRGYAGRGGLAGERLDNFVLAVNEAVTNVLDHGGGAGTVLARGRPGGVTVEIADTAGLLSAGHLAAARHGRARTEGFGFGLWLIQHLCDGVDLDQSADGSRLRLHMDVREADVRRPAGPLVRHEAEAEWPDQPAAGTG